jgi:stearoyl-CoA desaturase (delta-9 desaturase)
LWKRRFLLYFSILGGEGSPIAWATHHRHHHKYTEKPNDIHSPYESITLSLFRWQVMPKDWWLKEKGVKTIPTKKFVLLIHIITKSGQHCAF